MTLARITQILITRVWALAILLLVGPSSATIYLVSPDGSGDFPTIQAALDASANGDIIELADGSFLGPGNRDLDFGGKSLRLQSQNDHPEGCVIDCQAAGRGLQFHSGEDSSAVVRGVTIRNGRADYGGALACANGSSPTIENCIFSDNEATAAGALDCSQSAPTFMNCKFIHNSATDLDSGSGGAAYCRAGSSVRFDTCTFEANAARGANMAGGAGGGIVCDGCVGIFFHCVFIGNTARFGGGLEAVGSATVILVDCQLIGNEAGSAAGMDWSDSQGALETCRFFDNVSYTNCGAVRMVGSSPYFIWCTFAHNSAPAGGTAGCFESSPEFRSCTFAYNSAPEGDLYCTTNAAPTLDRSIIAFCANGQAVWCDETSAATAACCDVYGNVGGDWVGCIAGQEGIDNNFSAHPFFCDPEQNNFMLQYGSPCMMESNPECGLIGAWPVGCPPSNAPEFIQPAATLVLGPAVPNPFVSKTAITYYLSNAPSSELPVLMIHDATGRLVRTLDAVAASSGPHTISWDGADESGRRVEAGVYLISLSIGDAFEARPVLLVR